jgi:glutathione S-transferase
MITLYGFGPAFGLPDPSPFVTKVEVLLKLANLPYTRKRALPNKGPKGKMPWIVDDGTAISDSTFIRWHLEQKHGIDFSGGYGPEDLAKGWAAEKMLEDHAYWASMLVRWKNEANFEKGPAQFFESIPALIRPFISARIRRDILTKANAQGMGRHSDEEVQRLAIADVKAISAMLGDRRFFLGDRPSGTDATVYAFTLGVLCPLFDSPMRDVAAGCPNLVAYVERCTEKFYPEGIPTA